tara:strand:- start:2833 stop:4038 length:1206 start_codon:yes stop_codon:yes gene_type:complete
MPNIEISKLKVRRGTDIQRKQLIFDQGELIYTLDTDRLFVGSGGAMGGIVVGGKVHATLSSVGSLTALNAQVGDLVNVNNILYKLTLTDYSALSSWEDIGTKLDTSLLSYNSNNEITLNENSISISYLLSSEITDGLTTENGLLQLDYDPTVFELSGNKLTVKDGGIDEDDINSTALSYGLSGGSGDKLTLDIDTTHLYFNGNKLSISSSPPIGLSYSDLNSDWFDTTSFSYGLTQLSIRNTWLATQLDLSALETDVDNKLTINPDWLSSNIDHNSIVLDTDGNISVENGAITGTNQLAQVTIDEFGRVTNQESSIYDTLTGSSTSGSFNQTNSLSTIFNGSPSQTLSGAVPGLELTQFSGIDSTGSVISLSSAGFITFEGPTTTRQGSTVSRFAIPIFAY